MEVGGRRSIFRFLLRACFGQPVSRITSHQIRMSICGILRGGEGRGWRDTHVAYGGGGGGGGGGI